MYAGSPQHPPVTVKGTASVGNHIQCKHPRVYLHRAGSMADQGLDNFSRLAVIKHVHDIAVPESVWCDRNRKVYPVSFGPSRQPASASCAWFRRSRPIMVHDDGAGGDHPAFHLPDIAYICQRNQADLIFWRASASRTYFFGQDPHKRSYSIQVK